MTERSRHALVALAACACLSLGACGSSDETEGEPLPSAAATELQKRLDEVERRYEDGVDNGNTGACSDIQTDSFAGVNGIDEIVAGLPEGVDPDLRRAVEDSFANLRTLTEEGCADAAPVETDTEVEPVPEEAVPEVEPVPEETVPQETVPTETVEEPLPEDDATPEKKVKPDKEAKPGQGGGVEVPDAGDGE